MSQSHQELTDAVVEGLVSDRHFVGEMHPATMLVTTSRCLLRAPLTDAVRSPSGAASLGTLATLVDLAASDPALATCAPDWTATQDLSVFGSTPVTDGPIVVDSNLVRVGRKAVVVSAVIYDGRGLEDFEAIQKAIDDPGSDPSGRLTLAGKGLVTFVRIPRPVAPGVDDHNPAQWVGLVHDRAKSSFAGGSLYDRMNFRRVNAPTGAVELERTSYVANSIGTISGGGQALLLEVAAEGMCPGMVATDIQLHYLSQVKAGPARSSATVIREAADHTVLSMELVDAGNEDQLLALATVTLQR